MKFILLFILILLSVKSHAAIDRNQTQIKVIKRKLKVAIIDTGFDFKNHNIENLLWKNPGESGLDEKFKDKRFNGVDDDQNGFVDDYHGWNFTEDNHQLEDEVGHGTHIASLIVDMKSNKWINQSVELLILKYYTHKKINYDPLSASIKALKYAIDQNVDVINYSGGGEQFDSQEEKLIQLAKQKNIIIVAAAGNYSRNLKKYPFYPGSYKALNIKQVGALRENGIKASWSNYSDDIEWVVGENLVGWKLGGGIIKMNGSSQATAIWTQKWLINKIKMTF